MKTPTKIIAAFIAASSVALAIPLAAHAEAFEGGRHCNGAMRGDGPQMHGEHGGMRHMLRGLDLSEAQRDQIFELMHQQAPLMRAQGKELRASHQALRALSLSGEYDEARAHELAQQGAQAMAAMAEQRAKLGAGIYAVLNPQQRDLLRKREAERPGAWGQRHQGMPMGLMAEPGQS